MALQGLELAVAFRDGGGASGLYGAAQEPAPPATMAGPQLPPFAFGVPPAHASTGPTASAAPFLPVLALPSFPAPLVGASGGPPSLPWHNGAAPAPWPQQPVQGIFAAAPAAQGGSLLASALVGPGPDPAPPAASPKPPLFAQQGPGILGRPLVPPGFARPPEPALGPGPWTPAAAAPAQAAPPAVAGAVEPPLAAYRPPHLRGSDIEAPTKAPPPGFGAAAAGHGGAEPGGGGDAAAGAAPASAAQAPAPAQAIGGLVGLLARGGRL
jgi:translation initiation factor IF-2